MKRYCQLTLLKRYQLSALSKAAKSVSDIARVLGVHRSTVYRELSRNTINGKVYHADDAERLMQKRKAKANQHCRITEREWQSVHALLHMHWSPEQIKGRLSAEGLSTISHTRIYQYVALDKHQGGKLYQSLRQGKKFRRYRRRYGNRPKSVFWRAKSIHQRPKVIEARSRLGDFEGDTITSPKKQKGLLISLIDRKSRYTLLSHAKSKHVKWVNPKLRDMLNALPKDLRLTLTLDRGTEFSRFRTLEQRVHGLQIYFADPHASYQRGTNENTNGLIRQYFPKQYGMRHVKKNAVRFVQDRLNHRPRKCLGFKTPHEVFFGQSQLTPVLSHFGV